MRRRYGLAADEQTPELNDTEMAEPEVDAVDLQEQAGNLVRTALGIVTVVGLWVTWADVLPALSGLHHVVLWSVPDDRDGVAVLLPVTLVDAALALLFGVLAVVGAKNLPGAMGLVILNQMALDTGVKYALTTLARYVIAGIGITLVCSLLGMDWSRLQWLVAALSVGLGWVLACKKLLPTSCRALSCCSSARFVSVTWLP